MINLHCHPCQHVLYRLGTTVLIIENNILSTENSYALIRNMNTRSNDKLLLTITVIKNS